MANQEERCLATLLVKTVAFLAAAGPAPTVACSLHSSDAEQMGTCHKKCAARLFANPGRANIGNTSTWHMKPKSGLSEGVSGEHLQLGAGGGAARSAAR